MALARWEVDALMQPGEVITMADVLAIRPPWMAQAACKGMVDPRHFFRSRDEVSDVAREVCARCPVAGPCVDYAAAEDLEGTWAGTSNRRRLRPRRH